MSDYASLTDLENELWGDPQTSNDLMALGVYMKELTANVDLSPPTGHILGDLTDEFQDYSPGSYISAFVSGGPKNHAYRICIGGGPAETKTVCKVRGITINYGKWNDVNFDVLKAMVTQQVVERYIQIPHKIVRKVLVTVGTVSQNKVYRPMYTKRRAE